MSKVETLRLHDICPPGGSGEGKIDDAELMKELSDSRTLEGRIWKMKLKTDGKTYEAECILQTDGWKPKKGDNVRFDRQPETVDDRFLHATRLDE